jgi:hypothetical protein
MIWAIVDQGVSRCGAFEHGLEIGACPLCFQPGGFDASPVG